MLKKRILLALTPLITLGLTACHTLLENQTGSYHQTTNQDGETVYRRATPLYAAPPVSSPWPPPLPPEPISYSPSAGGYESTSGSSDSSTVGSAGSASYGPLLSSDTFGNVDLAVSNQDGSGNLHTGVHIGMNVTEWFAPRIGASLFMSKDVYAGLDLSGRFQLPIGGVKTFLGLGAYLGDSKECGYQIDPITGRYEEVCDKKFLTAGYAELGVELGKVSVFVRDYRLTRAGLSVPTNLFWGLGIRF